MDIWIYGWVVYEYMDGLCMNVMCINLLEQLKIEIFYEGGIVGIVRNLWLVI